jgi:hypothetical protein
MKNIALALLASVTLTASAGTVPSHQVKTAQVSNNEVIFGTQRTSFKIIHDCYLYLSSKSVVDIKPLRSKKKLSTTDSLVITVDGNKKVCGIDQIEELPT